MSNNKQSLKWEDLKGTETALRFSSQKEIDAVCNIINKDTFGLWPMVIHHFSLDTFEELTQEECENYDYRVIPASDFIEANKEPRDEQDPCNFCGKTLREQMGGLCHEISCYRQHLYPYKGKLVAAVCEKCGETSSSVNWLEWHKDNCPASVPAAPQQPTDRESEWQKIATMLYGVCKSTYGKEFSEWAEAKEYERIASLPALPVEEKRKFTKQQAYEQATLECLSDANGTRMDIIYRAMDIYANQPVEEKRAISNDIQEIIKRIEELKPYHINPYNLGDMGELSKLLDLLIKINNRQPSPGIDGWLPMETAPKLRLEEQKDGKGLEIMDDHLIWIDCHYKNEEWYSKSGILIARPLCWRYMASDRAREHYSQKK